MKAYITLVVIFVTIHTSWAAVMMGKSEINKGMQAISHTTKILTYEPFNLSILEI